MTLPSADHTLRIHLALVQYPILRTKIRALMRRELFQRGVITPQAFEDEVRERAARSQVLEGVNNPIIEEPAELWELRLKRVREHLTEFYFAYNLPIDLFEQLVRAALAERGAQTEDVLVTFNPELAPQDMLFEQAWMIEKMQPEERAAWEARLREIKVVLIRTLISDQLAYLNIAKDWFTIADLEDIRRRKIGHGKIGGKSAGMLLAWRVLNEVGSPAVRDCLRIPESYYLGADVMYTFMAHNGLMHWVDQKYKPDDQIRAEYLQLQQDFLVGRFPNDIIEKLRSLLNQIGHQPLIVRSSSLLEDNFGTSFAGKYESHFLPNQGTQTENLRAFTQAIIRIYASVFNADALLYRRAKGLQDYDERMAILIQTVQGEPMGRYFLPHAAGVGYSRNRYRWAPQIRRDDGFLRLVWGLGTRAVDRVGDDYPRLVALSHPLLHPESSPKDTMRYSQKFVDLLDLEENEFITLPVREVLSARYPLLRYIAQVEDGDYLAPIRSALMELEDRPLILTMDELFRRTPLADRFRELLQTLEKHYRAPVDTEFTVQVTDPLSPHPDVHIYLLQCRPQNHAQEEEVTIPNNLPTEDIIFSTGRMMTRGAIRGIAQVLFVTPEGYYQLQTPVARTRLSQAIGKLNNLLDKGAFICVGPGRWGTSTPDLGVHIGYGDIYNSRALIELSGKGVGYAPEASYGTHFFQDLMESNIYPLALYLDDADAVFNQAFFYQAPNRLLDFLPEETSLLNCLRIIAVEDFRPAHSIEILMDENEGRAVAYLTPFRVDL